MYFGIRLPEANYTNGSIVLLQPQNNAQAEYKVSGLKDMMTVTANGITLKGAQQQLYIKLKSAMPIVVKKNNDKGGNSLQVYIPMQTVNATNGELALTIKASGTVDKSPVTFRLNTTSRAGSSQALAAILGCKIQKPTRR